MSGSPDISVTKGLNARITYLESTSLSRVYSENFTVFCFLVLCPGNPCPKQTVFASQSAWRKKDLIQNIQLSTRSVSCLVKCKLHSGTACSSSSRSLRALPLLTAGLALQANGHAEGPSALLPASCWPLRAGLTLIVCHVGSRCYMSRVIITSLAMSTQPRSFSCFFSLSVLRATNAPSIYSPRVTEHLSKNLS